MDNHDLEQRLQSLERRLKKNRLVTGLLGLALIGAVGLAATAPKVASDEVRTRKLVIVDEKGVETVILESISNGGALNIRDKEGHSAISAAAADKGGRIFINDDKGIPHLKFTSEAEGGQVQVLDKKGQKNTLTASPK